MIGVQLAGQTFLFFDVAIYHLSNDFTDYCKWSLLILNIRGSYNIPRLFFVAKEESYL